MKIIEEAKELLKSNIRNNIQKIKNYYVFDALHFKTKIQSKKPKIRDIEKDIFKRRDLSSLLLLTLAKDYTETNIYIQNQKGYFIFKNFYKEYKRTKYFIEFEDATHFLTITYRAKETEDIFEKIEYNRELKEKVGKGFRRMRQYFKKYYKKGLKYIKVEEFTKKGTIHFHTLIKLPEKFREDFKEMIKKLKKWFETEENGIDLKYLKINERKNAVKYIAKYLNFINEHSIKEIENTKIFVISEEKILYNATKRRLSYSLKERPKITRYKTSELIYADKEDKSENKDISTLKIFNRNIEKFEDEKEKEEILKEFKKLEWIRYEIKEEIEKRKIEEEIIDF